MTQEVTFAGFVVSFCLAAVPTYFLGTYVWEVLGELEEKRQQRMKETKEVEEPKVVEESPNVYRVMNGQNLYVVTNGSIKDLDKYDFDEVVKDLGEDCEVIRFKTNKIPRNDLSGYYSDYPDYKYMFDTYAYSSETDDEDFVYNSVIYKRKGLESSDDEESSDELSLDVLDMSEVEELEMDEWNHITVE